MWKAALSSDAALTTLVSPDIYTTEIWHTATQVLQTRLEATRDPGRIEDRTIEDLALSPDGWLAASTHLDGIVRIFDTASGFEIQRLEFELLDRRRKLAFSPDGRILAIVAAGPPDQPEYPPKDRGSGTSHSGM